MKLTLRQKAVLQELTEFFKEDQKPIHYTTVAKRLGLSNSTAYEMMRILEGKGLIRSVYSSSQKSGRHGRARVSFYPGEVAKEAFDRLASEGIKKEKWDEVKNRILKELEMGSDVYPGSLNDANWIFARLSKKIQEENKRFKGSKKKDSLVELKNYVTDHLDKKGKGGLGSLIQDIKETIISLSETHSPLMHCAYLTVIIGICIKKALHNRPNRNFIVRTLLRVPGDKTGLSLLYGIALGLCLRDKNALQTLGEITLHIQRYLHLLNKLSIGKVEMLHEFTRDIWDKLLAPYEKTVLNE